MTNNLYSVVIIRENEPKKIFQSNLSKEEAEVICSDWKENIFNADVFFDPVPEIKVEKM